MGVERRRQRWQPQQRVGDGQGRRGRGCTCFVVCDGAYLVLRMPGGGMAGVGAAAEVAVVVGRRWWRPQQRDGSAFRSSSVIVVASRLSSSVVVVAIGDAGRHRGVSKEGGAGEDALKDAEIELGRGLIRDEAWGDRKGGRCCDRWVSGMDGRRRRGACQPGVSGLKTVI